MATLSTHKTATGTYNEPGGGAYTASARVKITATYTITTSNSTVSITATNLAISSISYGGHSHPQAKARATSTLQTMLSNNITLTFNNQQVFTRANNSPNSSYTVSGTKSVNRTKTNQNVNLVLDGFSTSINIPAKPSYTISYNMNGGIGNIANQTKWYDENLSLSSTIPTKDGYSFRGWATTDTATNPTYNAGGTYSANSGATLYAVWHQKPNCTYEVTSIDPYYNGGKDYSVNITGVTLYDSATLSKLRLDFGSLNAESTSSTIPTSSSPRTLSVSPNTVGTFTPTISITDNLGATSIISLNNVTVKQYISSSITIDAERVNSSGVPSEEDSGNDIATYGLITVTFNIPSQDYYPLNSAPTITFADENTHNVTWYSTRDPITQQVSNTVTWNTIQTGDTVYALINNCELLSSYTFFVTPYDNRSSGTTKSTTISQVFYTIDFLAGGHGVAFGMPSTETGFHCGIDAHFYEKALDDSGIVTVHLMPNNDFSWDSSDCPAESQYGVGYGIVDSEGIRTSNLDTHMYDDGRLATVLGAHRVINDEDVRNQLYLNIGDDGSKSYWVDDREAFRDMLGFSKTYRQLWSGALYMTANHTAPLSQKVSEQPLGIILVWSAYSSGIQNYDFVYQFVPKIHVLRHNGYGVSQFLVNSIMGKVGSKYVYVYDDHILGHAQNDKTGTVSGITYANNYWALRNVYGI